MNSPAADPRTKECDGTLTCRASAHLLGCRAFIRREIQKWERA